MTATAGVGSAAGPNLRRLPEVKATSDPHDWFRLDDNLAPGGPA